MDKSMDYKTYRYIIGALRKIWRWHKDRRDVLNDAENSRGRFVCNGCKAGHSRKEVVVDHIDPVVDPQRGWQGWDEYISRLFCGTKNLQVLCKECHKAKSNAENKIRRAA